MTSDKDLFIAPGTELEYTTSFEKLKQWAWVLEFFIVFFTLPHNVHVFRVFDFEEWTIWNVLLIPILLMGIAVLEGVFIFSLTHFTHGWIATPEQGKAAKVTAGTVLAVLIANSIASSVEYGGGDIWFYASFVVPGTPVIAVVLAGWLLSCHPATLGQGKVFNFIAESNDTKQSAELTLLRAKNSVQLAGIAAREEREKANLEISQIEQGMEIDQLRNAAIEKAQEWEFTNLLRQSAYKEQARQLHQIAAGEEYQEKVRLIVSARINEVLKQLNPGVDISPSKSSLPAPVIMPLAIPTPGANGHHKNIPAVTAPAGGGDDLPLS